MKRLLVIALLPGVFAGALVANIRPGFQEVRELVDQHFETGRHQANWDGRDNAGKPLACGAYFMRMTSKSRVNGELVQVRKMLLVE